VVRSGLLLNLAVTAAVAVAVQLLAEPLICMFDGTSPEVIRCGVQYLRTCCSINSLIYAAMYTLDSFAIGVGAAHVAMVNALLDAVVVRRCRGPPASGMAAGVSPLSGLFRDLSGPGPFAHPACSCGAGLL